MKQKIILFGVGLINLLLFFIFLKFVLFSISYGVFFIALTLFLSAIFTKKIKESILLKTLIIPLPVFLFSILFILEAKSLWLILPFYLLVTYLGIVFFKKKYISMVVFIVIAVFFCLNTIPRLLFNSLSIKTDHTELTYNFEDLLKNRSVTNNDNSSEIIVLAFFNTWCAPCIQEFPELQKLKDSYEDNKVRVVLVCAGEMDTKEKVLEFYKKRNLNFDLWYDKNSKVYKENQLLGVPSLIVLDKEGKIIHKHSGFNEGIKLENQISRIIDNAL
jgi:thiol-disulfide isomerase/thioredoxin